MGEKFAFSLIKILIYANKGPEYPLAPKQGFNIIPIWVADMNFPTVPTIQEDLIECAKHPMFGYFVPSKEYFYSIIR
jgi:cystathionine beta-lyase